MSQEETLIIHSFFSSSCGQRILIAAHLKSLHFTYNPVNLATREHETPSFKALNPSGHIPVLEIKRADGTQHLISQSLAILEYFEEQYPNTSPLLPTTKEPERRAKVRELVNIMATDCFPPTNSWVSSKVQAIRDSKADKNNFVQAINKAGFAAFEKLLEGCAGKYCVGDEITLADVCLVPQVDLVHWYGIGEEELGEWPLLKAVYGRLMEVEAFRKANWKRQIDTPEKFRE